MIISSISCFLEASYLRLVAVSYKLSPPPPLLTEYQVWYSFALGSVRAFLTLASRFMTRQPNRLCVASRVIARQQCSLFYDPDELEDYPFTILLKRGSEFVGMWVLWVSQEETRR